MLLKHDGGGPNPRARQTEQLANAQLLAYTPGLF